ncbi:MAG: metallophosphoesterase [Nanoarchaeota archaeon]|nr:metallophosphoesterase [Nanoarchaeota archaeon]
MRIAVLSDIHSQDKFEFIRGYLQKKAPEWKIDLIVVNGDILGENESREGYGYKHDHGKYLSALDRKGILGKLAPGLADKLASVPKEGASDSEKLEYSLLIKEYIRARYSLAYQDLRQLSLISKTLYNVGTYESPLLYNVFRELAFLLSAEEQEIRKLAILSDYRDIFKDFLSQIKSENPKQLAYIGGQTVLIGDLLIAGIPGFNPSSGPQDAASEFQENTALELSMSIKRQLSYAAKLVIFNQTQGRLRKDPFAFRPQSQAIRGLIEDLSGKLKTKVFYQSYHHLMTTHLYQASDFHFILSNSACNNCLFNILDVGQKVGCYDVDPVLGKLRLLNTYKDNVEEHETPEKRLSLNYADYKEVIKERSIEGCYYM